MNMLIILEVILFTLLVRLSGSTIHLMTSHHAGGKQVITFLDGYATLLECRSCLMYMSVLGKPQIKIWSNTCMYS